MISDALMYAKLGWQVFPLHTPDSEGRCSCRKDCGRDNGKHPRTIIGVHAATSDPEAVRRWWETWEDANIGVATGGASGIFVVDVDPRHGGDATLKALLEKYEPGGAFPQKVWASTGGGGWHLYFKHPGFPVKSHAGALGPGVDVKGEGGYVVAPPSLHASGRRYEWGGFDQPPDAPEWLLSLLRESAPRAAASVAEGEAILEGGRNQALTSLAGTMRRRGMSEESIFVAISVENVNRCSPPLPEADVRKIAHSVARYQPEDPGFVYPTQTPLDGERPDGIYLVSEISGEIDELYERGMKGGASTGIPSLDYHYTVKRGQWTVVTGIPSHGKSAVLDCVLHNLALNHDWRFAITSVENQPLARHAAQLMSIWAGEPFGAGDIPRMSRETKEAAKRWLDEHFVFVLPDEGGCTVGGILDRVAWLHANDKELHGIVIDPWNELEHRRPAGMTETEYVSQSLARMRRFARQYDMHLWLVAHPTKLQKDVRTGDYPVPTLYDISGSSHFRNKADFGLSVWRNVKDEGSAMQLHVQKVRFRECGRIGVVDLYFDVRNGRFLETPPTYFTADAEQPWEKDVKWD